MHLHREPVGEWFALDARTVIGPSGVGVASSVLHDEHGPVGRTRAVAVRAGALGAAVAAGVRRAHHGGVRFADRSDAGRVLARALAEQSWTDPLVLGLARGGVPVAVEVASALGGELGVAVARKIGAPGHPEYGIGAVTADGDGDLRRGRPAHARPDARGPGRDGLRPNGGRPGGGWQLYRAGPVRLEGRDVLVVDDGLATGVTARAALREARGQHPRRLVLAVPVGAADSLRALRRRTPTSWSARTRATISGPSGGSTGTSTRPPTTQVVELLRGQTAR